MPFVHKDAAGNILAVYTDAVEGAQEVASDDPALVAFIHKNIPAADRGDDWMESDLALARVIEDLIEVLIDKKLHRLSRRRAEETVGPARPAQGIRSGRRPVRRRR